MVLPGLPLALNTLEPFYLPFNHAVMSISKTTKDAFVFLAQPKTWHRTDHLPPPPPKDQSAIAKLPWHISLSRISNTWWKTPKFPWNGRRFEWELGPVPALSYVQNCGPVDIMAIASSQCKALFGLFSLNRNKSFVIQLS